MDEQQPASGTPGAEPSPPAEAAGVDPQPRMIAQSSKDTGRLPVVSAAPSTNDGGTPHQGRRASDKLRKKKRKGRGVFRFIRDTVWELCKIVVIVLLLRAYVLQASSVDGQSMEPTLHHGDYLLVERLSISLANMPEAMRLIVPDSWIPSIERGDIVVLSSPENSNNELVKRVLAVEGDRIFFFHGLVYVNGEAVDEPYIAAATREALGRNDEGVLQHLDMNEAQAIPVSDYRPSEGAFDRYQREGRLNELGVKVPQGCLFVIGDNRLPGRSNDSRSWTKTHLGTGSPATGSGGSSELNHMWATVRSVHGRVLMRLRAPWDYDSEHPVFPQ